MPKKLNKTSSKKNTVLSLQDVCKEYVLDGISIKAIENVNLEIEEGELVSIVGPSGSGKSTLLHLMGLLDTPTCGTISLAGRDVSNLSEAEAAVIRNKYIGFVFQQFNLLPRTSTLENVLLPTLYNGGQTKEVEARAVKLLTDLGMQQRLKNYSNQLSGGQQQRVAIARALINNPKVVYADEPTGNLDTKSGHEVVEILKELHKEGRTIVIVTHDPDLAKVADRQIKVLDGHIVGDSK